MKRIIATLMTLCLCISLCACGKSAEAKKVDELILAIGTVTEESEGAISAAQKAYDALTADQKGEVENHQVLVEAQEKLAEIKALITTIETAYTEAKWDVVYTSSNEYLAAYPDAPFAKTAQSYKDEAFETIDTQTITLLKEGDLATAKLYLEAVKDDAEGAAELLSEVDAHIAIAGDYFAPEYIRKQIGKELPYQGSVEAYKLTVAPFMTDSGEWAAQYTVDLPGLFYIASSSCFTFTCIGEAKTGEVNTNTIVAVEINPQIDYWNTRIIEEDTLQIYATPEGYQVIHIMYSANSPDYDEFTLNFTKG